MFLVSIQRRHVAYCYEQKDFWYVQNISNDERLNLTREIEGVFHFITLSTYIIWKKFAFLINRINCSQDIFS